MNILAPRCPGCDGPPKFIVGVQAFCGAEGCKVLAWDMTDDPARFKASAVEVDLSDLRRVLPSEVERATCGTCDSQGFGCPDCVPDR